MHMHRLYFILAIIVIAVPSPSLADLSIGLEYAEVEREVEDVDSSSGNSQLVSLGIDLENSLFKITYSEEETDFEGISEPFQRSEGSFAWHWNETSRKNTFTGFAFGFFLVEYDVFDVLNEEFWGLTLGAKRTQYLISDHIFFSSQLWLKLPYSNGGGDPREADSDQAKLLFGIEGEVALGFVVGKSSNFALFAGARYRDISFSDRFLIDDTRFDIFLGTRILIPTSE